MPLVTDLTSADLNAYADELYIRDYCTARGFDLPTSDDDLLPFVFQAMDWLETKDYIGAKVELFQPLQWPRKDAIFSIDQIPVQLKQALARLTYEATLNDLMPTVTGSAVKSEEVSGAVKVEYATADGEKQVTPRFLSVEAMLRGLLSSGGSNVKLVRG